MVSHRENKIVTMNQQMMNVMDQYQPVLFLSPIAGNISAHMIGDAVNRMRIGTVGNVVVRPGKHVDFAIVTMSSWDLRASAKFRQLMSSGGFMKVFYGRNMYWKAFEYKTHAARKGIAVTVQPQQQQEQQFEPRSPSNSPPGTPVPTTPRSPPPAPMKRANSLDSDTDMVDDLTVQLLNTAFIHEDAVSEMSEMSENSSSGYDDVDQPAQAEEEAGVLLNYGEVSMKRPVKRLRIKTQLSTNK